MEDWSPHRWARWGPRRVVEAVFGLFCAVFGFAGGVIWFLEPRPQINVVYVTHTGSIWYQNTCMISLFFIGLLGSAIFLNAAFHIPGRFLTRD